MKIGLFMTLVRNLGESPGFFSVHSVFSVVNQKT